MSIFLIFTEIKSCSIVHIFTSNLIRLFSWVIFSLTFTSAIDHHMVRLALVTGSALYTTVTVTLACLRVTTVVTGTLRVTSTWLTGVTMVTGVTIVTLSTPSNTESHY